jgi:type II secretory pathway pseudopilin PulG
MKATDHHPGNHPKGPLRPHSGGFTLPAVLVVVAALLILAVGILLVTGIERSTTRSFVDRQRAELAARAGFEEVRSLLARETANDDFIVLQSALKQPIQQTQPPRDPAPHLFIARAGIEEGITAYRYVPLFSTHHTPQVQDSTQLRTPEVEPLVNPAEDGRIDFTTLPYQDQVRAAWIPVRDEKNRTIARYAYWVEDLQGKIDAKSAGNTKGPDGGHLRTAYPFPAPGMNSAELSWTEPKLDQVAIHVLDPASGDKPAGSLTKDLIAGRPAMLSPDSALGAAGILPPLARDSRGVPQSPLAAAVEANVATTLRAYEERPLIPFAPGIDPQVSGKPKLNLNALLELPREAGIEAFAGLIKTALPEFERRNPAFPENYLETLAAAAFDYADKDQDISVENGRYRGLESAPLLSEVYLQVNYLGRSTRDGRRILNWRFTVCAELWNMSNLPASGSARVSYEVDLHPATGFGSSPDAFPFDDPELLDDPAQSTHSLTKEDGLYWTPEQSISLGPNQYRFLKFADVLYSIDAGSASTSVGENFDLVENEGSRGMSLQWNGKTTDRIAKIKRLDTANNNNSQWSFRMPTPRTVAKAGIPGHTYRSVGRYWNNMGDPRISYYIRSIPLDENAAPENLSPNRRNVRISSIYKANTAPTRFYGRVLPSEWPDGGHNSQVGSWSATTTETVLPTDPRFNFDSTDETSAPLRISNAGHFFSPTELGHLHDPLMWKFAYNNSQDTNTLLGGNFPTNRLFFPDVIQLSTADATYGGGNTLRIGRREHPRFDAPGLRAAHLLDLFHAGHSTWDDEERRGPLVAMHGNVNLNTAGRDAIRALAAGVLMQDKRIARMTSRSHRPAPHLSPAIQPLFGNIGTPTESKAADKVADAILAGRPFASWAEVASASIRPRQAPDPNTPDPLQVFGNREMYPQTDNLEWNDAAAEETFARVFEASTLRSRNFRVWVVAQAIAPQAAGSTAKPEILAEVRRAFTIFSDPGTRDPDGAIQTGEFSIRTTHENDF